MSRKVVGQAVALSAGYYPDDGVHCRIITEGETFNVVEGLEAARWFKRVDEAPKVERTPKAKRSDADKEREQVKAEATPPSDIA